MTEEQKSFSSLKKLPNQEKIEVSDDTWFNLSPRTNKETPASVTLEWPLWQM